MADEARRERPHDARAHSRPDPASELQAGASASAAASASASASASPVSGGAPAIVVHMAPRGSLGSSDAHDAGVPAPEPVRARVAARVREALRCPYCRDAVSRRGVVSCARAACGAVYHPECWEECRASYGGCAVFGCGSREARALGRAGWLWRLLRLALAAALFPPQVIRALRQEGQGVAALRATLRARARHVHALLWAERSGPDSTAGQRLFAALQLAVVLGTAFVGYDLLWRQQLRWERPSVEMLIVSLALTATLAALALYASSWAGALAVMFAKAVLAGEFAALERADAGQGGYLARVRGGGGKK